MIKKLLAVLLALFAAAAFAAVDVNTANQADLESVKGIGPAISAKIIDERKKGSFKDWQDMVTRVKGIGEKNSAEFSAGGLTVNGAAFAGAPAKAAATTKKRDQAVAAKVDAAKPEAKKTAATPAVAAPEAAPAVATTKAADAPAPSAADKKAAAKKEREDKKAAKAAKAEEAKQAKADKKAAKAASAAASAAPKK